MEKPEVVELDPVTLQFMEYNFGIVSIGLIALIITIVFSYHKDGIREVIENIFLWFLLFFGVTYVSTHPVTEHDEITGGIFFVAFGLCRIAKNMGKGTGKIER